MWIVHGEKVLRVCMADFERGAYRVSVRPTVNRENTMCLTNNEKGDCSVLVCERSSMRRESTTCVRAKVGREGTMYLFYQQ